jgi:hypothetical protein
MGKGSIAVLILDFYFNMHVRRTSIFRMMMLDQLSCSTTTITREPGSPMSPLIRFCCLGMAKSLACVPVGRAHWSIAFPQSESSLRVRGAQSFNSLLQSKKIEISKLENSFRHGISTSAEEAPSASVCTIWTPP